ncbi:MAG: hypothetical protein ACRCUA_01470 [Fusobacteriaceae bacterium]
MKKLLIILCCFIFFLKLQGMNDYFAEPVNFSGVNLGIVVDILSMETGVTILLDEKEKEKVVDIYFPGEITLLEILEGIGESYNLKINEVSNKKIIIKSKETPKGLSLSGKVTIKGHGLDDVKITLLNSGKTSVFTKYDGKYIIDGVYPGTYIIRFEKNGFLVEGDIVTLENKNEFLNKDMEMSNLRLENYMEESESKKFKNMQNIVEKIRVRSISVVSAEKIVQENFKEVSVSSVEGSNILILSGDEEKVIECRMFLEKLEKSMKQVRISAQIITVNENLFERLGFNWFYQNGGLDKKQENFIKFSEIGQSNIKGSRFEISKLFKGRSSFFNFSIDLLQGTEDLSINSVPSIVVIDGEVGQFKVTESLKIGNRQVITDGAVGNEGVIDLEPIFNEAGIFLEVTPYIKEDKSILLRIMVEDSNFSFIRKEGETPPKEIRSIKTAVLLKDGDTVVIGGLKKVQNLNYNSQIPILGDIPALGKVFQSKDVSQRVSDLYIKLKVDVLEEI